jgi:hypothetical protein
LLDENSFLLFPFKMRCFASAQFDWNYSTHDNAVFDGLNELSTQFNIKVSRSQSGSMIVNLVDSF